MVAAAVGIGGAVIGAIGSNRAAGQSADASRDAADTQSQSAAEALEFQREALAQQTELNQPYVDLGTAGIPGFQNVINNPDYNFADKFNADPYGANYLANNPLFQASIDNAGRQIGANSAASGKFGSGGMVDALFQNYLATGDQYYGNYLNRGDTLANSAVNRAALPVTLGQNAAVGQGANIGSFAANAGNLATQSGNAQAAGIIGAANAQNQNIQNLAGIGSQLIGYGANSGWFQNNDVQPYYGEPFGAGSTPGEVGYIDF